MRDDTRDVAMGLLADYCGMLREAAFVLAGMADSPETERAEELDALAGVHAESEATYGRLTHALAAESDDRSNPWWQNARQLTEGVHAVFAELVRAGSCLGRWEGEQPPDVLDECRVIERTSSALDRAWRAQDDPVVIERQLWSVRLGVAAVGQALDARFGSAATITLRTP